MQKEITITEEDYMEFLDEVYGTVSICGIEFNAGYALKKLDPVAFRVGKSDYEDSLID